MGLLYQLNMNKFAPRRRICVQSENKVVQYGIKNRREATRRDRNRGFYSSLPSSSAKQSMSWGRVAQLVQKRTAVWAGSTAWIVA